MRLTAALIATLSLGSCAGRESSVVAVERPLETKGLPPIAIRVLVQPEHRGESARFLEAAAETLKALRIWSLVDDVRAVTLVDPPWHGAAPSELSAVVLDRTPWWTTPTAMAPELSVARSLGRRAIASSIDTTALPPWFVHGMSEYLARRIVLDLFTRDNNTPGFAFAESRHFGGFVPRFIRIRLLVDTDVEPLPSYRRNPSADVTDLRADRGTLAGKTVLLLTTLDRWVSRPVLDSVVAEYFRQFRGRRPTLNDFSRIASAVSGQDLSWLFVQTLAGSAVFDYAIADLTSRPAPDGAFATSTTVARVGDGLFTGATAPRVGPFESGRGVWIAVSFTDGTIVRESWDGRDARKTFQYRSAAPAVSAVVDPDRLIALDVKRANNSRTLLPQAGVASRRWASRWMLWLEEWLLTYSALV